MCPSESFLNEEETEALNASGLHRRSWFLIRNVSTSYFSPCRHFGGGIIQNERYTYNPKTDELIRDDVLKWVMKRRRDAAKAERARIRELKAKTEKRLF
jgi:hypothetical protein